jgi:hypothetical protein
MPVAQAPAVKTVAGGIGRTRDRRYRALVPARGRWLLLGVFDTLPEAGAAITRYYASLYNVSRS